MTRRHLDDQLHRDLILNDLDSTFLVEAAAGTGKTTQLVNRIVRVIEEGVAQIREIVAVTFTEKAAGELKLRVREQLEKARSRASGVKRQRLTDALAHLEEAHVSTIHGFCADLLRERPVEARLDPLFTTLTEGQSQDVFDRAFMLWFQEQLVNPPEGIRRALRRTPASPFRSSSSDDDASAPIDRLRGAAWKLAEWRDFTCEWRRPEYSRDREIDQLVGELHAFAALTRSPSWDKDYLYEGTRPVRQASDAIARDQASGVTDYDGWEARLVDLAHESLDRISVGRAAVYKSGVPRPEVIAARDSFVQLVREFCQRADADLAALLASELRGAVERYEHLKERDGSVDFLDLLLCARNLLYDSPEVRRTFQGRFKRIFVDEFQDTDPVQAEIIFLLAADESRRASKSSTEKPDWRKLRLRPGALFIVADPKQSIYRFRRADIETYYEVRDLLLAQGARAANLTTSFRSQRAIQNLVNAAFAPEMTGDRQALQAEYVPLTPSRPNLPAAPALVSLPVPSPYGKRNVAKYAIEKSLPPAIAAYIDWLIHRSGWRVSVPDTEDETEPIAARHICVLFRRFVTWGDDVTRPYVEGLEARGIPHVLVGGRTFHDREEVENMRAALAAVEWPDDELSVFATLRGPLFAIGDEELLEWRHRFGHFHPFSSAVAAWIRQDADLEVPERLQPIAESLSLLRALHIARNHRPIADTVHRLIDVTRAHVSLVLRPRGEQVLANVLQIAELARQYELEGGLSFRGFVERLREESESAQAAEAPVIEEGTGGVRLMTVHKAKGLEFPVVILADITAKLAQRDPDRYIEPVSRLCVLKLAGWMPLELREQAALERVRDEAEGVRLAYVAATRARDLLVVPAVGDKPFDDGWLRPLNPAIYPSPAHRREQRAAPGCPPFKSKDSVLGRPNDDPATADTVSPGLHEFGEGKDRYTVAWWDPRALILGVEPSSGIRRPELITKEASAEVIAEGLAAYESWRRSREAAVEAGSHPSMRVHVATAWAARSDTGLPKDEVVEVEVVHVDLPSDRPSGAHFGSLVHSVLSVVPLDAVIDAIRAIAEVHGRILGSTPAEIAAAPAVVERILAHPVMSRARTAAKAGALQREVPVMLRTDAGELVDGVVDLMFEEDARTVLVDFKTDSALGTPVARYKRQLQAYALAVHRVKAKAVSAVLLSAGS
ncbi:MAG TPA: UvrD-helicase domain-containing protein [Vicinamibacterales bacterium]|nr:UvrD-helicase domain-containing protein [Vicinamibacterales bacterium]